MTLFMLGVEENKGPILELLRQADLGIVDLEVREDPGSFVLFGSDEELDPRTSQRTVRFQHRGSEGVGRPLPFDEESVGTTSWFALVGPILRALDSGGLLCVDELDASLHPRLASFVLEVFQRRATNPKGAQLLFNSHVTTFLGNLLGEPLLRRDQIWFVEKDEEGASHLYPLTDFKPRKEENLERGYLQGRYGAVPFVEKPGP